MDIIQLRKDTREKWLSVNPILLNGEFALVASNPALPTRWDFFVVGDGETPFSGLLERKIDSVTGIHGIISSLENNPLLNAEDIAMSQKGVNDYINRGYTFMGIADKSVELVAPTDQNVFWLANEVGDYGVSTQGESAGTTVTMSEEGLAIISHKVGSDWETPQNLLNITQESLGERNAVPSNAQLCSKLSVGQYGKNLFNRDSVILHKRLSPTDSRILYGENSLISDYIKVKPNDKYCINLLTGNGSGIHYYDSEFKFLISQELLKYENVVPDIPEIAYLRFTNSILNLPVGIQFEFGEIVTKYEPYTAFLPNNSILPRMIPDSSIPKEKVDFYDGIVPVKIGKNKYNPYDEGILKSKYLGANGELKGGTIDYSVSDFIPLDASVEYCFTNVDGTSVGNRDIFYYCFYDAKRNLISSISSEGITSFRTPLNCAYARFTLNNKGERLKEVQLEKGTERTLYKKYSIIGYYLDESAEEKINGDTILDQSISSSKLKDGGIGLEKFSGDVVELRNIYDQFSDVDFQKGTFLNTAGVPVVNSNYDTTGYIKVTPLTKYFLSLFNETIHTSLYARSYCEYDADKKPILSTYGKFLYEFTPTENATYIRLSVYTDSKIVVSTEKVQSFIPSEYKIKHSVIAQPGKEIDVKYFFLPKDIYCAEGRVIEIYYSQMVLNPEKYNIDAKCEVGISLERKFQIIGSKKTLGEHLLTIRLIDDFGNLVKEQTSTVHIVPDISVPKSVVAFGDSLTNGKAWLNELKVLSSNKITLLGTRGTDGLKHEGRSGMSAPFYNDRVGKFTYTFDANYVGTGKDALPFDEGTEYSVGSFVSRTGDGEKKAIYRFKTKHTANTPWSNDEVKNISQSNPLWNFENDTISINHYKQFQSINPDIILIWLGTNGINLTPKDNPSGALGIKYIVDNIRREDASTPIIIVDTIFKSGQNGIGKQGNVDGYSSASEYKFNADRKVLLLAEAIEEMMGTYPNIYIAPVGLCMDSKYDFMDLSKARESVNPRIPSTDVVYELYPEDSVHPQEAGYMQCADEIYSTICAIANK